MALDPRHDPDTGRRVLQCGCGASHRNVTPTEALQGGWIRTWGDGGATRWHCPDCAPPPPRERPADPAPPPPPSALVSRALSGEARERATAQRILEGLFRSDPARAWIWLAYFLARLPERKRVVEDWSQWAHLRRLWDAPMLAQHSSGSNEHYTPPGLLDLVREVFGQDIDLDPCSCAAANTLVRARRYYTEADDGLTLPWEGTVFVNPPGNKRRLPTGERASQAAYWWAHLSSRFADHFAVTQAAFQIFNLELLRHAQGWDVKQPLDYAVVFFRRRIEYYRQEDGRLVPGEQPPHPSALVYLGPHTGRFREVFEREGPFAGYVHVNR